MFKLMKKSQPEPDMSGMALELQKFFRMVDGAWQPSHLVAAERWLTLMGDRWGLVNRLDRTEIAKEKMYTSAWQYLDKKRAQIMQEYKYDESQLKVTVPYANTSRTERSIKSTTYESIKQRFDKSIGLQILRAAMVTNR